MNNPPFFRPMLAGFAVTTGAMLILPMRAKADAPEAVSCASPAPKSPRLHFGKLLTAAQQAGMGQMLSGGVRGGAGAAVAGAVANAAVEAAAQAPSDAGARPSCVPQPGQQ